MQKFRAMQQSRTKRTNAITTFFLPPSSPRSGRCRVCYMPIPQHSTNTNSDRVSFQGHHDLDSYICIIHHTSDTCLLPDCPGGSCRANDLCCHKVPGLVLVSATPPSFVCICIYMSDTHGMSVTHLSLLGRHAVL
jgi:hypothetical protein